MMRRRGDRGATTVEFAFVVPVLLLLMLAMIDIGLAILGNSVGSNAARDGARVGIIRFRDADVANSSNRDDIEAAVRQRVVGLLKGTPTIAVRCIDGDSTGANPPAKPCNDLIERGRDVIEVKLTWQHIGLTPFVSNTDFVETARLVIVGEVDLTEGTPPPLRITADNPSVVEGGPGDTTNLVFTVTRSYNTTTATVAYATGVGGSPAATAGTDYTSVSGTLTFPAGGALTQTVSVPITVDDAVEGDEKLALNLTNPTTSSGTAQAVAGTGTITNDDFDTTPPVLQNVQIYDNDADGKLDYLVATFNEALGAGCPGTWSFSDASGASVQSAAVNGATVQVFLNEGGGYNTSPTVTVTGSGTCDLSGNAAGSQTGPIVDRAAPRVVGLGTTSGSTAGLAQSGDTVSFVFSEAVIGVPGSVTVTLNGANGNGNNDSYSVSGITGPGSLGRSDYVAGNNKVVTFSGSTTSIGGSTVTVTLGTCSGCGDAGTASSTGTVAVSVVTTITDAATNAAGGTFASAPIRLF